MGRLLIFFCLFAAGVQAQSLITPEEFEDISEGKTLYFNNIDGFHGAEQYFADREVKWKFAEGQCQTGYWYAEGDAICFQYDNEQFPICWHFWQEQTGIYAQLLPDTGGPPLKLEFVDTREILCDEPYLGVKADVPVPLWTPIPSRP